jgi:hypothetical protein
MKKVSKRFFFEKKKQKTSALWSVCLATAVASIGLGLASRYRLGADAGVAEW